MAGKISAVKALLLQNRGKAAASRLEKAADLVPNLERQYTQNALYEAFPSENANSVTVMDPRRFERYAARLTDPHKPAIDRYTKLFKSGEGASDVPYLIVGRDNLSGLGQIKGHEGRHRSRALAGLGDESTLVRVMPDYGLREPLPRGSQEEYLAALSKKIGNPAKVIPENREKVNPKQRLDILGGEFDKYLDLKWRAEREDDLTPDEMRLYLDMKERHDAPLMVPDDRAAIELPEMFAGGGQVKKGVKKALSVADMAAALKSKGIDPVRAEREAALERARINAVKILGLPENNTPMDRARAMGYEPDRPMYHGSLKDIKRVRRSAGDPTAYAGQGFYTTPSPQDASMNYASVIGPDQAIKIERGFEESEKHLPRTYSALRDGTLSPARTEAVLREMGTGDNLGVVYPVLIRRGKEANMVDRSRSAFIEAGERYDPELDEYLPTENSEKWRSAVSALQEFGVDPNDELSELSFEGGSLADIWEAIARRGSVNAYDPETGSPLTSEGLASEIVRELGGTTVTHPTNFRNPQLNIAGQHTVVLDPQGTVRSRFAAFDPAEMDSDDLLKKRGGIVKMKKGGSVDDAIAAAKASGTKRQGIPLSAPPVDIEEMRRQVEDYAKQTGALKKEIKALRPETKYEPALRFLPEGTPESVREAFRRAAKDIGPSMQVASIDGRPIGVDAREGGFGELVDAAGAVYDLPALALGEETFRQTQSPLAAAAVQTITDPLGAVAGAPAAGRLAGKALRAAGRRFDDAYHLGEGPLGALTMAARPYNVIKPKGGNWLQRTHYGTTAEDPTRQLDKLKYLSQGQVEAIRDPAVEGGWRYEAVHGNEPLNTWIDKQLTRYVRNEMGTPEDPLRALAERGVVHYQVPPPTVGRARDIAMKREKAGMPASNEGQSPLAINWEIAADHAIDPNKADDWLNGSLYPEETLEANPWLAKVDPNTPVYTAKGLQRDLGFDHLVDELNNALNPESGLPRELLLRAESMPRLSVPQAVERVAKINQWRKDQKAIADAERANNAATRIHKEYPEGYRWVKLGMPEADIPADYQVGAPSGYPNLVGIIDPSTGQSVSFGANEEEARRLFKREERMKQLQDALKYEGETMGHCVGGYCDDVASGRSQIYSLRDAKGMPHVTVEVNPYQPNMSLDTRPYMAQAEEIARQQPNGYVSEDVGRIARELAAKNMPPTIGQIKGKGNAKPNDEYLPFVQDFVKSGNWSDVRDFQNTGLIRRGNVFTPTEKQGLIDLGQDVPEYLTQEDIARLRRVRGDLSPEEGMKRGGPARVSMDAMRLAVGGLAQRKRWGGALRKLTDAEKAFEAARKTRAKAAQEEAGLYHPISGGVKLQKPIEMTTFKTEPDKTIKSVPRKIIKPEDLQGGIAIPLLGDRAAAGRVLLDIDGRPLTSPVTLEGGPEYMLTHTRYGDPNSSVWASGKSVISGLQKQIEFARDMGRPIYGVNVLGSPTQVNFNTMLSEAILGQYDPSGMTKKARKEFLRDLRTYAPDPKDPHKIPGKAITETDLDDVNLLRAKLLAPGAGELRKAFVERLGRAPYVGMGFPDVSAARLAITDPELVNAPIGSAGYTIGRLDPAARALENTVREHKTYPLGLAGEYEGSFEKPVDYRDIFTEFYAKRRLQGKDPRSDLRSFDLAPQFQEINQEVIDNIMDKMGANKPREWKKGGRVSVDQMKKELAAPKKKATGGEITADDLILEERAIG